MPRSCSIFIQSDLARRASPRALTRPAACMAPPKSRRCSVNVVLPASGWEMMAKVRRRAASLEGVWLMDAGGSRLGKFQQALACRSEMPRQALCQNTARSQIHFQPTHPKQESGEDDKAVCDQHGIK